MKDELFKGLTEEQIIKVKACKNVKEILLLAKQEGIELNDDQLAAVCGGGCSGSKLTPIACPVCGADTAQDLKIVGNWDNGYFECTCKKCGHKWVVYY